LGGKRRTEGGIVLSENGKRGEGRNRTSIRTREKKAFSVSSRNVLSNGGKNKWAFEPVRKMCEKIMGREPELRFWWDPKSEVARH